MENEVAQWEHQYLKNLFPDYDYRNPTQAWKLHCRDSEGISACAWQMKAFHYWWIMEQCRNTGEIGLAIDIDNLPFCINVYSRKDTGHSFCAHNSVCKLFNGGKFPLIVASALLPYYPCTTGRSRCDGSEIVKAIDDLAILLKPEGVLVATLMDETGPRHEGRSLRESANAVHAWTVREFEKSIIDRISFGWKIEEFDTFKNDMSFNLVLRKT